VNWWRYGDVDVHGARCIFPDEVRTACYDRAEVQNRSRPEHVCFSTGIGFDAERDRPFNGTVERSWRISAVMRIGVNRFVVGLAPRTPRSSVACRFAERSAALVATPGAQRVPR
jgi:hypothetical protein